jgi:hypothetical protein
LRASFRQYFSQANFDPRAEVGMIVAGVENIIARSFRDARRTSHGKERALHRKVALDAFEKLATLYQDVGLIDRRDFLLPPSDGPSTRIPPFEELQALRAAAVVTGADLTSDAERDYRRAWAYGDAAQAEAIANEAVHGAKRNDNGH